MRGSKGMQPPGAIGPKEITTEARNTRWKGEDNSHGNQAEGGIRKRKCAKSTQPIDIVSTPHRILIPTPHLFPAMQAGPRRITPYSPYAPCRGERRDYLSSTKYPTSVPARTQISPGVWSDGRDRVFSSAYPAVQQLLKEARATLKQPLAPNEIVFTLAALDVFYKPSDPAHWIFWSDEKKLQTAEVVTRIALHQPPLIRTPVAWNGSNEYLYILANHHGSSHRQSYETQTWYQKLVPQKSSAAPKVLNLRKRKAIPGAFREPSKSPGPEEDDTPEEPPRKKLKGKPVPSPELATSAGKGSSEDTESSIATKTQKTSSASPPEGVSHESASQQPGTAKQDVSPSEDPSQTRMSTRNRKVASSQASTSSRASSVSPTETAPSGSSHSRTRSISHTSSQTAVASSSRRSASVLSASTVVDGRSSAKGKGEGKDIDDAQSDDEGMVTRGRASRARVDTSKTASETESEKIKGGKPALTVARNGTQKVKRKP
ncbi:hypothetical protein NP233_g6869 [Leucocoprinus birnbaumii]|uniref:Uncharacterized protein n=1 Tax=Leucocoprinus birnbaumii TaxID=56174 RepID=A0AAD5YQJ2_9AGAR|nr:hypothetical protein NP233_g6869 [Leucocoprinus birnbaumii]